MYGTGVCVCVLLMKYDEIMYIGRKDFQVNIRRQKIELSEIENTIEEIKEIDSSIVIDRDKENFDYFQIIILIFMDYSLQIMEN